MKKKLRVEGVPYRVGLMKELKDPELAVEYLRLSAADPRRKAFLTALRNVAEANGVAGVARKRKKSSR